MAQNGLLLEQLIAAIVECSLSLLNSDDTLSHTPSLWRATPRSRISDAMSATSTQPMYLRSYEGMSPASSSPPAPP
jgi:hypothetical protein